MGKENCKRPKAALVKKETGATPICKNTPVEPEVDSVEESEPEYEFCFKVAEASSGRPLVNLRVTVINPEGIAKNVRTGSNGVFRRRVEAGGHTCQLKFESLDPVYKLKVANPTATTKQKGAGPTIIEVERRLLEIVSVDPHFVPTGKDDDENLQIRYHIHGIKTAEDANPKVYLAIRTESGPLYRKYLTQEEVADGGNKLLTWDGKINHSLQNHLLNKLANPLIGPFEVLLVYESSSGLLQSNREAFNILFHSIKIKPGSYLEDPAVEPARINPAPADGGPQWADHIKWIQYRLNKLGYFAGVVNGVLNDQTKRAVKRFTYEMINHPEADFALNNSALRYVAFLDALEGESLKVNLFENEGVITDKGTDSKIYIQNNYYYHVGGTQGISDYVTNDGHYQKEASKLDRFEYPIEAEIKLKSRSSGNGINAPQALTGVEIKWTVINPDEDTTIIPAFNEAISPSQARLFVRAVLKKVKVLPNVLGDNCPESCGGVPLAETYFYNVLPGFPVRAGADRSTIFSGVCTEATKSKMNSKTGVLFRGSFIGGDKFILKAEVDFTGHPNAGDAKRAYDALPEDDRAPKTGKMTQWRKRRAVNVIDWLPEKGPAVEWGEVVNAFKVAHIEFDVSDATHVMMNQVVNNANSGPFLDAVASWVPEFPRAKTVFQYDQMMPLNHTRNVGESADDFKSRVNTEVKFHFNGGTNVTRLTLGAENDPNKMGIGEWIRGIVGKTKRPGIIILRTLISKGVDVLLPKESFFSKARTETAYGRDEGKSCTGIGGGVAFLTEDYRKKMKDGFLTTHEIAHCFYINHPVDGNGGADLKNKKFDHDMGDKNNIMIYLHNQGIDLSRGSTRIASFCGKSLLKLRGWKVNGNDPAIAAILPENSSTIPPATPCNARMRFDGYFINDGYYEAFVNGNTEPERVRLTVGAKDPSDPSILLGPQSFLHKHTFTWESSDGYMESLAIYKTRERITFNQPSQNAPFNEVADPEQDFAQQGEDGEKGFGIDRHSIRWPALICKPGASGKITGAQVYQYIAKDAPKGTQWTDIPESNFILEKEVYLQDGKQYIKFRKANGPGNPNNFEFIVSYRVGQVPASPPYIKNYHLSVDDHGKLAGDGRMYVMTPEAIIWKNGKKECSCKGDTIEGRATTLEELEELGYLAPKPWP